MKNLAYKPTQEEKKHYTNKIRKMAAAMRELGYDWEEIEEEAVRAASKYITMLNGGETHIITFQDAMEIREMVWKWKRAE